MIQAQTAARPFTRLALVLAAVGALIVSMAISTSTIRGAEGPIATLNPNQVGTDSADGEFSCPEGDEPVPGEVLWHFVLNGLDPAINTPLTITATFQEDGALQDTSAGDILGNGSTHQFFIITSGDDVLLSATVNIGDSDYNVLTLSHICRGSEESTPTPTPTPALTPTPTPEQGSPLGGTGTPAPSVPNTALSLSGSGSLATIFFGAVLIASLGALAYANVTAVRRRR